MINSFCFIVEAVDVWFPGLFLAIYINYCPPPVYFPTATLQKLTVFNELNKSFPLDFQPNWH